jgi:hypothetical protein
MLERQNVECECRVQRVSGHPEILCRVMAEMSFRHFEKKQFQAQSPSHPFNTEIKHEGKSDNCVLIYSSVKGEFEYREHVAKNKK